MSISPEYNLFPRYLSRPNQDRQVETAQAPIPQARFRRVPHGEFVGQDILIYDGSVPGLVKKGDPDYGVYAEMINNASIVTPEGSFRSKLQCWLLDRLPSGRPRKPENVDSYHRGRPF